MIIGLELHGEPPASSELDKDRTECDKRGKEGMRSHSLIEEEA